MSTHAVLVLTTCASAAEGERLAATMVARRLAACVNRIDGVVSTYRWQDAVERGSECLLLVKTTEDSYAAVERTIREASGYELPEVLRFAANGGSADYLRWIATSVEAS